MRAMGPEASNKVMKNEPFSKEYISPHGTFEDAVIRHDGFEELGLGVQTQHREGPTHAGCQ